MSPRSTLMQLVEIALYPLCIGTVRSGGITTYVREGRPIPDFLMPGRLVMRRSPEERRALGALTSADAQNVAPWAVKQAMYRTEELSSYR